MINCLSKTALILACLTTLTCSLSADTINGIKAAGVCSAFGCILPAAMGVASHFFEDHMGIEGPIAWRKDTHLRIEASKLLQTAMVTSVGMMSWAIMKGFVSDDICAAITMISIYSYGQGRAFFRQSESRLLKATSYGLPVACTMLLYTRVPSLAPYLDIAGKPILVFVLAHICGA